MTFQIISTGWECRPYVERTLASIEGQTIQDYKVRIVVDPCKDGTIDFVREWCDARDDRWSYEFTEKQRFSTPNQVAALEYLDPDDDDIIVWLDLDGDELAHPNVLKHLLKYYSDGTQLTYGSFKCVPYAKTNAPAEAYPAGVIENNDFRTYTRDHCTAFNHLRTMKGRVARAIPRAQFFWRSGPHKGKMYSCGADYIFMVAGLELVGANHKFIKEILCNYNHDNPHADFRVRSHLSEPVVVNFLSRPRLRPIPELGLKKVTEVAELVEVAEAIEEGRIEEDPAKRVVFFPMTERELDEWRSQPGDYLPQEVRRDIIKEYGEEFGLRELVETGTLNGETPLNLASEFDTIYTIELDRTLYRRAVETLKGFKNVTCIRGDSAKVLPNVLRKLKGPALFWLDGHYSGPGTGLGSQSTPIREELAAIWGDDRGRGHVILIDDARVFYGGGENPYDGEPMWEHYGTYPSLHWVEQQALEHGYTYELKDDIIRMLPV